MEVEGRVDREDGWMDGWMRQAQMNKKRGSMENADQAVA